MQTIEERHKPNTCTIIDVAFSASYRFVSRNMGVAEYYDVYLFIAVFQILILGLFERVVPVK